ncbi:hypothetical protein HELRODRAFT_171216 [Helobdella robusta]|uniref:Uncharacterized protein n=1 Tax=Helobdella robusta TaxID=6412 RepID=T1F3Y3_HELRO|nr:hypothetical protein HELRODRAFT_171216 [Helobdella robusta]ESO05572.1 hypothetical protein HELRODRAFT_171216 [Helobdella robusta]
METDLNPIEQLTKSVENSKKEFKELKEELLKQREKRIQLEKKLAAAQERVLEKRLNKNSIEKVLLERKAELENAELNVEKYERINQEKKKIVENLEKTIAEEDENFKAKCFEEDKKFEELMEQFKELRRTRMEMLDNSNLAKQLQDEYNELQNNVITQREKEISELQSKVENIKLGESEDLPTDGNVLSMKEKKYVMYIVDENIKYFEEKENELRAQDEGKVKKERLRLQLDSAP